MSSSSKPPPTSDINPGDISRGGPDGHSEIVKSNNDEPNTVAQTRLEYWKMVFSPFRSRQRYVKGLPSQIRSGQALLKIVQI
jgi:hypothetical protein